MSTALQQKFAALQQDLGNGKWKQVIAPYMKADRRKAIWQIVNTFGPFLGIWILMYFTTKWTFWLTIPLAIVNAFFLVRIFIIQHDCGHQSFFGVRNKHLNNAVGVICSMFSTIPYTYWAKTHNFHHSHSGQLEVRAIGDISFMTVEEYKKAGWFKKLLYRLFRLPIVLFFFAPIAYVVFINRVPYFNFKGMNRSVKWDMIRNNLLVAGLYTSLALLIGWKPFLLIQGSIVIGFAIIAFWFFYVQHQYEETYNQVQGQWDYLASSILGATYYRLPRVLDWLSGSIGVHHIHHLASAIPNYNLQKCRREQPILSKYVTEIGLRDSIKCVWMKLWDEHQEKMISWRTYRKLYKNKK